MKCLKIVALIMRAYENSLQISFPLKKETLHPAAARCQMAMQVGERLVSMREEQKSDGERSGAAASSGPGSEQDLLESNLPANELCISNESKKLS